MEREISVSECPSNQMKQNMQRTAGISQRTLACLIASTNSWKERPLLKKQIYIVRMERISVTMVQNRSFFIPVHLLYRQNYTIYNYFLTDRSVPAFLVVQDPGEWHGLPDVWGYNLDVASVGSLDHPLDAVVPGVAG